MKISTSTHVLGILAVIACISMFFIPFAEIKNDHLKGLAVFWTIYGIFGTIFYLVDLGKSRANNSK